MIFATFWSYKLSLLRYISNLAPASCKLMHSVNLMALLALHKSKHQCCNHSTAFVIF